MSWDCLQKMLTFFQYVGTDILNKHDPLKKSMLDKTNPTFIHTIMLRSKLQNRYLKKTTL